MFSFHVEHMHHQKLLFLNYTNIDCHPVTRLNNPIVPIFDEAKQIHMYICNIRTFVQERKVLQMQDNIMLVNSFIFIFVKLIQNPLKQ